MAIMSPEQAQGLVAKGLLSPESAAKFGVASGPPPGFDAAPNAGFMGALANAGLGAKLDPSGVVQTPPKLLSPEESDIALQNLQMSAPAFSAPSSGVLTQSAANAAMAGAAPAPAAPPPPPMPAAPAPAAPMPAAARGTAGAGGGGVAAKDPRLAGLEESKRITTEEERRIDQDRINAQTQAERDADAREHYNVTSAALDYDNQLKHAVEAKAIDERVSKIAADVDAYKNAKADPGKYWKDGGVFGAITGILSLAVGGARAGMTGGVNQSLAFIERQVDRDIAAQQAAIDRKGKNISQQQSLLGDMRSVTQSNDAARSAAKAAMYQSLQDQLAANAAKDKSPEAQSKATEMINALEAKKNTENTNVLTTIRKEQEARAAAAAARAYQVKKDDRAYGIDVAKVRIDAAKEKNNPEQKKLNEEVNQRNIDLKRVNDAFDLAEANLPTRGTEWATKLAGTQGQKQYESAKAELKGVLTTKGEHSESDYQLGVLPMMPTPGDGPEVLASKRALALKRVDSANPNAATRDTASNDVGFTDREAALRYKASKAAK
jgi:hypothetical protein